MHFKWFAISALVGMLIAMPASAQNTLRTAVTVGPDGKVPAAQSQVPSVAGRTGAIVLTHADVTDWTSLIGTAAAHAAGDFDASGAGTSAAAAVQSMLTYVAVASNTALAPNSTYAVNTSSPRTLTLPPLAGLTAGEFVRIQDASGLSETNPITVTPSGSDALNVPAPVVFSGNFRSIVFVVGPSSASWTLGY